MLKVYTDANKISNNKQTIDKIRRFFDNNKGDIVITPEIANIIVKID